MCAADRHSSLPAVRVRTPRALGAYSVTRRKFTLNARGSSAQHATPVQRVRLAGRRYRFAHMAHLALKLKLGDESVLGSDWHGRSRHILRRRTIGGYPGGYSPKKQTCRFAEFIADPSFDLYHPLQRQRGKGNRFRYSGEL
eukprot:1237175-Rhodomonas_salina.1